MEMLGYKANMFDIQAAMLRPQLKRIAGIRSGRKLAHERYESLIQKKLENRIRAPKVDSRGESAYHLFTIQCPEGFTAEDRNALIDHLVSKDIGVGVHYNPVHLTQYYRETLGYKPGSFPNAESFGWRTITLPFFVGISEQEQAYVVDAIAEFLRKK
jgi:UDP-4-amino-4-deoxy-L-arabinose-oxoglutarate aminotransferase